MPKRVPPEPQTGGSIEDTILQAEDSLRASVEKARQFVREGEEMLQKMAGMRTGSPSSLHRRTVLSLPYLGWQVIDAILHFLDEKGEPQKRDEIIRTVIDRGVYIGKGLTAKGDAEAQVSKSLAYHLASRAAKQKRYGKRVKAVDPKLKEFPDGKIGRADWKPTEGPAGSD
jgi:hypothetical protein